MKKIADTLFLVNALYFVAMATAHFFSIKLPVLFIYFDVPFYAYQDRIISFAVCAYVLLFWEAYRKPSVRLSAILLMYITCLGLSLVNLSEGLQSVMRADQTTLPYWIQTGAILVITLSLHMSHRASTKPMPDA